MPQFNTIGDLRNFINTKFTSNGSGNITGLEDNNALISLTEFIEGYSLNAEGAEVANTSGVLQLSRPVTIVGTLPASLQWPDNVQNQYYIVNTLGVNIPLSSGYSYYDESLVQYDYIPASSSVQIIKAENGSWIRVNAAVSSVSGTTSFTGNFDS